MATGVFRVRVSVFVRPNFTWRLVVYQECMGEWTTGLPLVKLAILLFGELPTYFSGGDYLWLQLPGR